MNQSSRQNRSGGRGGSGGVEDPVKEKTRRSSCLENETSNRVINWKHNDYTLLARHRIRWIGSLYD
jgi:hypothetical protein